MLRETSSIRVTRQVILFFAHDQRSSTSSIVKHGICLADTALTWHGTRFADQTLRKEAVCSIGSSDDTHDYLNTFNWYRVRRVFQKSAEVLRENVQLLDMASFGVRHQQQSVKRGTTYMAGVAAVLTTEPQEKSADKCRK